MFNKNCFVVICSLELWKNDKTTAKNANIIQDLFSKDHGISLLQGLDPATWYQIEAFHKSNNI